MGDKSGIEWTDATWNPTTGCDRVSPGCDNCYALALAARLKAMGAKAYQNDGGERSGPGFALTIHLDRLDQPRRWRKPRMVFVNSMSDLFHSALSPAFIKSVLDVIVETPQHTYQVLTKRPRRMHTIMWGYLGAAPPPPNLWLGVSIESRDFLWRLASLRHTFAATRFVSFEPLLEDIGQVDMTGIDWVIAGGESGPRRRPFDKAWARSIRDQCQAAGVPFFYKQGSSQWAGKDRELDGRTWDEFPA